jgi:hypothetical protein
MLKGVREEFMEDEGARRCLIDVQREGIGLYVQPNTPRRHIVGTEVALPIVAIYIKGHPRQIVRLVRASWMRAMA